MRCWTSAVALASAVSVLSPAAARAQDPVRPDCRAHVTPTSRLAFTDSTHRRWYDRYWAGKCDGLSFFSCSSGKPHWNDAVEQILKVSPPERSDDMLAKACKLGQLIGFEWARDNSVRCIHTSDADKFMAIWNGKGAVSERLDRIEARARTMLRCRSSR